MELDWSQAGVETKAFECRAGERVRLGLQVAKQVSRVGRVATKAFEKRNVEMLIKYNLKPLRVSVKPFALIRSLPVKYTTKLWARADYD